MNIQLHYDVPGDDFTRAGEASSAVKRKMKQLGFQPDVIRRMAIAMYEERSTWSSMPGRRSGRGDFARPGDGGAYRPRPGIPDVEQAMQEGWSTAPDNVRNLGFGRGWDCRISRNIPTGWRSRRRWARDGHDHDRSGKIASGPLSGMTNEAGCCGALKGFFPKGKPLQNVPLTGLYCSDNSVEKKSGVKREDGPVDRFFSFRHPG